jgi:hypothetical protein
MNKQLRSAYFPLNPPRRHFHQQPTSQGQVGGKVSRDESRGKALPSQFYLVHIGSDSPPTLVGFTNKNGPAAPFSTLHHLSLSPADQSCVEFSCLAAS